MENNEIKNKIDEEIKEALNESFDSTEANLEEIKEQNELCEKCAKELERIIYENCEVESQFEEKCSEMIKDLVKLNKDAQDALHRFSAKNLRFLLTVDDEYVYSEFVKKEHELLESLRKNFGHEVILPDFVALDADVKICTSKYTKTEIFSSIVGRILKAIVNAIVNLAEFTVDFVSLTGIFFGRVFVDIAKEAKGYGIGVKDAFIRDFHLNK